MKYIDPELRISRFDSLIKTDAGMPVLAPVSDYHNEATRTLTEIFETAAENAAEILVYRW